MSTRVESAEREWFGHPRGLTVLFLTEMWEKFSYYGMRALLVYYMTKALLIPQAQASAIYGYYASFTYFTPILGAVLADRFIGKRAAVVIGGSIMALGHFLMSFDDFFYIALTLIGLGNGLFLPSLPSQVARLYRPGDPRQTSGYSIYYVGINIGAFLAPLVCGFLGEFYGWHYGFAAAGVGMLIGVTTYVVGLRYLPPEEDLKSRASPQSWNRSGIINTFGMFILIASFVIVFRGAYEQLGNTVALWADHGVDRRVGDNLLFPMTWFQAVNPLGVFLLTPLVVAYWRHRAGAGNALSSSSKMSIGAGIVSISYLLLAAVSHHADSEGMGASWLWLVAFVLLYTVGELFILPVGLSLFGRLAPPGTGASMIALWFLAAAGGNLLAGQLGALWSSFSAVGFFIVMAGVSGFAALLLRSINLPLQRLENRHSGE